MIPGLYLSAAGLQAQEKKQDLIANNLANATTHGFKRDLAIIQARANASRENAALSGFRNPMLENQGGGVLLQNAGVDLTQAALQTTSSSRDMALDGRGFFVLQGDENHPTVLTRDGHFATNSEGTLIHIASGRPVLGDNGEPIKLNPSEEIAVDNTGRITQPGGASAQLKLVDVNSVRALKKIGGNALTASEKDLKPLAASTLVHQGHLEMSGVDPMVELVNMISGQRAFDANAKLINMQDQTLQQLNTIGRVA